MMRYTLVILVAVAALIGAAPASAQLTARPKCDSLACRAASQKQNLAHARYLCHQGRHEPKRWGCHAVGWLTRELHETKAALAPAVPAVSHFAGWSCITNGAYPGAPHEGNGYNGSWTGPLGMTTPWAGVYPPGSDWVHTPVAVVYSIADRVAAAHHYDDVWMRGQWPNTYPPCAGYFH